jgi:pimeloyl-ACP methyl ester carboxylesterase
MPAYLPVFTSPAGQAEVFAAYQSVLDQWPVPYTELDIPTSFGQTHVIASGAGSAPENPPIVFMHALFATATAWYRNVGPLSQHFRTYAVDVLGEANKSRPTRTVTTQAEMAQWFGELLDALGIRQTYLVGNSYGAFMSAYYAMRLPDRIRRLVLIGPAATFHPMTPFYLHMFIPKALGLFFPWLPGQARWMRHSLDWMHAGLPQDPVWAPLFYRVLLRGSMTAQILPRLYSKDELRQITAPTLLLIGEREKIYRPQDAIRAAKRLMPNLQVESIPDAHHITALSQPELVNQHLLRFFREGENS